MSPASARRPAPRALPGALALVGLLLVAGNLRAALTSVGPVLERLQLDLGLSSFWASMLISLPLLAFALVSPLVPALAERLGLERTLAGSLGVLAAGVALRSLDVPGMLWLGTALLGVAIATLNVALPSLVKRDHPTRIGQITGLYSAVQSIFAALAAGLAVPLAEATALDWRLSLGVWAGFALIALAVFAAQRGSATETPVTAHAPVPAPASAHTPAPAGTSVWRSGLAWLVTAFMGMQSLVYYVLITWLPSIEIASGIDPAAAGFHLLVLNGSAILGSLACSALIPRFRDQRGVGVLAAAWTVASATGLLLAPALAWLWAAFVGLAGGMTIVLALSLFGLRTRDHRRAAQVSGMAQAVGYLFAAAGPPAIGALHDVTDSWAPALGIIIALGVAIGTVILFAGRDRTID